MSDKSLKITDRRMFTADGELREQYRDSRSSTPDTVDSAPAESRATDPPPAEAVERSPDPARPPEGDKWAPLPDAEEPGPGAPGFMELVGLLPEPAAIYLGEARGADPQTAAQNLELARLHIDLLAVLRAKTQGNLSVSESASLEDVVYQLRSGYVGLRG